MFRDPGSALTVYVPFNVFRYRSTVNQETKKEPVYSSSVGNSISLVNITGTIETALMVTI